MNDPIHQISLYLDNALAPEQLEALSRWIEASPENAELFAQVSLFNSDLREELGIINQIRPVPDADDFAGDTYEMHLYPQAASAPAAAATGIRPWQLKLAAMVLIAGALGLLVLLPGRGASPQSPRTPVLAEREPAAEPAPAPPRPVASVLRVTATVENSGLFPGTDLVPGRYELEQGFVELTMRRGATVIVQGPCTFDLVDDNRVYLYDGQLTADVPARARLFTVQTPAMSIVDLGTRFGTRVESDGSATAAVFEGMVVAQENTQDTQDPPRYINLSAGQSIQADRTGRMEDIAQSVPADHSFMPSWRDVTGRVKVTGQARFFVQPPASIAPNALIDPDHMIVFQEQITQTDAPIRVMTELSATAKRPTHHARVPAGTRVISYMVHFNPARFIPGTHDQPGGDPAHAVNATIQFPGRVLGLVSGDGGLANTNQSLGLDSVAYLDPSNTGYNNVIDTWPTDRFKITGEQQNILEIQLTAGVHSDQARVLVEVPAN